MSNANELKEFDVIAAGITEIQEKGNFIPDMSTKEGYEASKRFVLDVTTPTRTKLKEAHKKGKAYWLNGGKAIDAKKNEIMSLLEDIQKPHQDAYKAKDQEEKDKKAKFEKEIQDKINFFHESCHKAGSLSSAGISDLIDRCGEIDTEEGFYHLKKEAIKAREDALLFLNEALMSAVNREAEQKREAELAEENRLRQIKIDKQEEVMRIQQEEIDRKQAELDRVARQIEKQEQAEAAEKQRLIDEASRAERERLAAIEREEYAEKQAKLAAEQARLAEKERQELEAAREKEAAEKREANKRHNAEIHRGILKVLTDNGISEDDAKTVIRLAAKRELPNLVINY